MKKKFFLTTLATLSFVVLASCGGGGQPSSSSAPSSSSGGDEELNIGAVEVMCDEKITDVTKAQIEAFMAAHPKYKMTYSIKNESEAKAAGVVLQDVDAAPDVYFFAQDQLARLVTGGGIAQVPNAYKQTVIDENDSASVGASTVSNTLYAYPATSDNTFFLYYDTRVLNSDDVKSFETIITKSKQNSKKVYFNYGDIWNASSFFFGAGLKSEWKTDKDGKFIDYDDDFNSAVGEAVVTTMHNLFSDTTVAVKASSNSAFEEGAAALVSGTWAKESVVASLGENMGVAVLPSFKAGNGVYQLKPFGGFKLVGMKPQTQTDRTKGISQLAMYLTNESSQLKRFEKFGWGPSNKNAQNTDAIKGDAVLKVCFAQMANSIPQGQFPGDWWAAGNLIGESAVKDDYNAKAILKAYSDSLEGFLQL